MPRRWCIVREPDSDELENSGAPSGSAKRLWTFNLSQIFCSASPAAHEEFEADYSRRWYERFGLGYYGCCEPLHDRIGMLSKIPDMQGFHQSLCQRGGGRGSAGQPVCDVPKTHARGFCHGYL